MKQRLAIVLMACSAMAAAGPSAARAEVNFSASIEINAPTDFYQPLAPYGSWVEVSSYGRCWHPTDVGADWAPYTAGHWEWTDAGWYWQSDEPWGWACCHYGSWYYDPSVGWVWIPGTEWAPAWVTWRDSDDYIGWAPCGPGRAVLAPSFFVFCDVHRFRDHFRNRHDFIVNNTRIIERTRVIRDFHRQTVDFNGRQRTIFANRGPGVDPIERATGQKFTPRPVHEVIQQSRRPENMRGNEGQRREGRDRNPAPTGREQERNYQRQNATPEQRNYQQPQPRTPQAPAATGREQQRNYQNPDTSRQQRNFEQPRTPEQRPQAPAPTGREQQRNYQQPAPKAPEVPRQPEQKAPQHRPDVNPPTGREQPRVYPEAPKPNPAPEQRREIPKPEQRPAAPEQRALPPTGRQEVPHAAPPERQAPVPQAPADGHGRDRRDHDQGP
jgi:hypothetical protein